MTSHTHYFYTFGESFCRRMIEKYRNIRETKCLTTKEEVLVGGGKDFCSFVTKQAIKYAASRSAHYQTPRVEKSKEQLVATKTFISGDSLNRRFHFAIHLEETSDDEVPSVKRIKVELSAEPYKNQVFAKTLHEVLSLDGLVIDTGNVDETPPSYSPFNRSTSDLRRLLQTGYSD